MPDDHATNFNRLCARGGIAIWALTTLAIAITIGLSKPGARSVTPVFHMAADAWWSSLNPYNPDSIDGFLYLPQAAIIFTPFYLLGQKAGDIAWLCTGALALSTGVWQLIAALCPPILRGRSFLLATILLMFAAAGNMTNGQFNITFAAITLHVAALLAREEPRRKLVAAILVLGVALKPLAIVHLLLNAGVRRSLWIPLIVATLVAATIPLLHPSPIYAFLEYGSAFDAMRRAAEPPLNRFNDIRQTLRLLHLSLAPETLTALRIAFALIVYGIVLYARPKLSKPTHAWLLLTLGSTYIMLFNPRTEGLTYVVLVAPLAVLGSVLVHLRPRITSGGWLGWLLCTLALVLGLAHVIAGPNSWLRPTATIPLLAFLLIAPLTPTGRRTLEIAAP